MFLIAALLLLLIFTQCATFRTENMAYNQNKLLFDYQIYPDYREVLRNDSLQLVDSANVYQFYDELEAKKNHYTWERLVEESTILTVKDFKLAKNYAQINEAIQKNDYQTASAKADRLLQRYPDALKYTDVRFLKGFSEEHLGNDSLAIDNYAQFMKWSGKRYSQRFRGYRYFNLQDTLYPMERHYASNKLNGFDDSLSSALFEPLIPQYFFESFQPGYGLNPDQLGYKESKDAFFYILGFDFTNHLSVGINYYRQLTERLDFLAEVQSSYSVKSLSVALPITLYQSDSKRLGVKFTPFVNAIWMDSLVVGQQKFSVSRWMLNAGGKLSAGYYLMPNLALGAYYRYNIVNKLNPLNLYNQGISVWLNNEYDLSLYYNIYSGLSLKTGIKNNGFVAGFFLSGWEMTYNFTKNEFILSTCLY
jgi:hypothetical protein